jgi:hypothetical protein
MSLVKAQDKNWQIDAERSDACRIESDSNSWPHEDEVAENRHRASRRRHNASYFRKMNLGMQLDKTLENQR